MNDDDMKNFLVSVAENYRFTTKLDMEILGRVAADLTPAEAESILSWVRATDADPARLSIPAFTARARATIDHRTITPSTPRRMIDYVRGELGRDGCDSNGEALDAMSCITKFYERCWEKLKELPDGPWRERLRRILRRQVRVALVELDWEEGDADAVAAMVVEMPLEGKPETTQSIGAGLQV